MFTMDGIVYGGEPKEIIKVTTVKPLDNFVMLLTFNSGETRLFDATILTGTVFEPLKDREIFASAYVDHGVVTWKDGEIDCAPEFMYKHSYEYSMVS